MPECGFRGPCRGAGEGWDHSLEFVETLGESGSLGKGVLENPDALRIIRYKPREAEVHRTLDTPF